MFGHLLFYNYYLLPIQMDNWVLGIIKVNHMLTYMKNIVTIIMDFYTFLLIKYLLKHICLLYKYLNKNLIENVLLFVYRVLKNRTLYNYYLSQTKYKLYKCLWIKNKKYSKLHHNDYVLVTTIILYSKHIS